LSGVGVDANGGSERDTLIHRMIRYLPPATFTHSTRPPHVIAVQHVELVPVHRFVEPPHGDRREGTDGLCVEPPAGPSPHSTAVAPLVPYVARHRRITKRFALSALRFEQRCEVSAWRPESHCLVRHAEPFRG
jgi:hypothetical protein